LSPSDITSINLDVGDALHQPLPRGQAPPLARTLPCRVPRPDRRTDGGCGGSPRPLATRGATSGLRRPAAPPHPVTRVGSTQRHARYSATRGAAGRRELNWGGSTASTVTHCFRRVVGPLLRSEVALSSDSVAPAAAGTAAVSSVDAGGACTCPRSLRPSGTRVLCATRDQSECNKWFPHEPVGDRERLLWDRMCGTYVVALSSQIIGMALSYHTFCLGSLLWMRSSAVLAATPCDRVCFSQKFRALGPSSA
jgi:hypothetical protein